MKEGMNFKITRLACDADSRRILNYTKEQAKKVKEIADGCQIPLAKCYRRIKEMELQGMMKRIEDRANKMTLYIANLASLHMMIEEDRFKLNMEFKDGTKRAFEFDAAVYGSFA